MYLTNEKETKIYTTVKCALFLFSLQHRSCRILIKLNSSNYHYCMGFRTNIPTHFVWRCLSPKLMQSGHVKLCDGSSRFWLAVTVGLWFSFTCCGWESPLVFVAVLIYTQKMPLPHTVGVAKLHTFPQGSLSLHLPLNSFKVVYLYNKYWNKYYIFHCQDCWEFVNTTLLVMFQHTQGIWMYTILILQISASSWFLLENGDVTSLCWG